MPEKVVWSLFLRFIQRHRLLSAGDTVIVGVSGGPDSLCLLHLMCRLRDDAEENIRLVAAHLDHGIRPESKEDAEFVAQISSRWGVPCVVGDADVPALAEEPGLSLEEAARIARYRFLLEIALEHEASAVAVGHNADDQVESVLMHWLRGSGLAGLRGMLPQTPLGEMRLGWERPAVENGPRLIRPLLECTRQDIEAYCQAHDLHPLTDQSNLDTTLFRNRLRHELLPYLEGYNPNIRQVIRRSAAAIARDYDYCHQQVLAAWSAVVSEPQAGVFQFDRGIWETLHPSMQAGLLREAIRRLRWSLRNVSWTHIEDALDVLREGHVGQKATLPQGLMVTIGYQAFWVADERSDLLFDDWPALAYDEIPVVVPGVTRLGSGSWALRAEIFDRRAVEGTWESNASPWRAYLDTGRIDMHDIRLRIRLPGDRFQPLGMAGQRKDVREFMIGAKLPRAARERYPLVVSGNQILWIPGFRLDERVKVRENTHTVLVLTMFSRKEDGET